MDFPVVVNGRYYSDAERCSHCGRPRPRRRRRWNAKTGQCEDVTTLCRECQRRHRVGGRGGASFEPNANCPACRDTGMVEVKVGLIHFDIEREGNGG